MAKVTYLSDLISRQVKQILALDKEELFFIKGLASKKQRKVAGRSYKIAQQLVALEWESIKRGQQ